MGTDNGNKLTYIYITHEAKNKSANYKKYANFWLACLGPLILLLPELEIIWLCNLSILNVPEEGLFQKRVVRTKFDIYVFSSPGL